jgi:hypothetical protein
MARRVFAAIALAVAAVFVAPLTAQASGYVPADSISVSGTPLAGATVSVDFAAGAFTAGEAVTFAVDGAGTATLSAMRAATVTLVKSATPAGAASVNVTLPADASGSYTTTATGQLSGAIGTATITVTAADAGSGLAGTGYDAPVLLIWAGVGALVLGVALVVVLTLLRRQRAGK